MSNNIEKTAASSILNVKLPRTIIRGASLYISLFLAFAGNRLPKSSRRALEYALLVLVNPLLGDQDPIPSAPEMSNLSEREVEIPLEDKFRATGMHLYWSRDTIDDLLENSVMGSSDKFVLLGAREIFNKVITSCEELYGHLEEGEGW
jgi:hypothetical protein